jgi:hypothetical protein
MAQNVNILVQAQHQIVIQNGSLEPPFGLKVFDLLPYSS